MKLSVVIPRYNEEKTIRTIAESSSSLTAPASKRAPS
jgi:glycosyltransferase involved in cell wall biosynthesis